MVASGKVDKDKKRYVSKARASIKLVKSGKSKSRGSNQTNNEEEENQKSQIGATMEELTGQRVAQMMLSIFMITILFTYYGENYQEQYALAILHKQTTELPANYSYIAVDAARRNTLKYMFQYTFANGTVEDFPLSFDRASLWPSEILNITVTDYFNRTTIGLVSTRRQTIVDAICDVVLITLILIIWFVANVAFSGPVMQLVVIPIERMIKLLRMMMTDPLGYQNSYKFMKFVEDEKQLTDNTGWTSEILKGMET